jgi:hypothetical protein
MTSLCYFYPKGREVLGRQELDLKTYGKLGVDFIKDLLYRTRILDQGVDRTQQKFLHVEKPIDGAGRVRLRVIGFKYGRPNGCRIKHK